MNKNMFTIGKVVNTHGVRGEIRVIQVTDFDDRFVVGNEVYWVSPDNQEQVPLTIDAYRTHKNFHLLHFQGYDNINDVERFKGGTLAITKEQQTPLDEGEFYYHEIIGCHVETTDGSTIGKVKEILSPGANDVWVIQRPQQKDVLIPYIEQVVKQVDPENEKIIIEPMEGLLE
ncbi:ribosome maturation factor RimM [Pontibacillus marinus]|uniref:Ribosome maturation factor RimM n=1 Tax=Pontibacillus marinus BH030004 = DSM 16465 TaxID=1385511 RepID=A0A0A5FXZ9_9BACI|nr:ribosome maturation factor RimM [Pontibacillus marinus]KGX83685.1 16S rRNA-processing protein RimM [Pontibacillus marinus BH030004 = DSM 16465]